MVKRLFSLVMLLCCIVGLKAQQDQDPQLPLNPNVIHGVLPNGLNYYVLKNTEPKGRANFYIAQKVGSTLETKQQLGLAHFLEHMAFNGTKNFPGKNMLEYLQHNGIRFGEDINAYTGFDETVYRINNVPTNNQALMDSVLLMLHDWSCDLLLEDEEIDNERGVIQEEWRQRNDASTRMMQALFPQIYDEYQYSQSPIGLMEVVMNFPYKDLRDYYHKWYRPDQQGIVVVGDFDPKQMAEKIVEVFTPIVMPENAAERTYAVVSDNKGMRYATYEDPEITQPVIQFFIKRDITPVEQRDRLSYYVENTIANTLICSIINERLAELTNDPNCAFSYASARVSQFWIAKTKEAVTLVIVPKKDSKAAFNEALEVFVRACRTGFTESEVQRAKDQFMASMERMYNEREKTDSHALGQELIRTFIDNEPAPGIDIEWDLCSKIMPFINAQVLSEGAKGFLSEDNQVLTVVQPKKEGYVLPSQQEMQEIITGNFSKEYEAYVDNVLNEPLIAKMPKKGSVKSEKALPEFGATELTLSNGAKVIVKTTDFSSDEIRFSALAPFGSSALTGANLSDLKVLPLAVESSKLGNFDIMQLQKALSGKQVSTSYSLDMNSSGLTGSSSVKDLETLMQLIYLQFTNIQPDETTYAATLAQYIPYLENNEKTPDAVFSKEYTKSWYNNNPAAASMTSADMKAADYAKMLEITRKNLSNAADYDFIFVGNVDVATLKPLLEQYIASLPGNAKKKSKLKNNPVKQATGKVDNFFDMPMQSPQVKELVVLSGNNVPYNVENSIKLSMMGDILSMIYIRTLREEIGGTYGASATGFINPRTNEWTLLYAYDTGDATKKQLDERAVSDLNDLMQNGATVEDFNKCKEAALSQFDINKKNNKYWMNKLRTYSLFGIDEYTPYRKALENLTLEDLNKFMKNLYDGKNRIHVTMTGTQL